MATLENVPKNYSVLINEVRTGQVKIPQFQRQFVWDIKSSAKLIDSIIKGYPIGTFIFWRTNEELRAVRNIGNIVLPVQETGEFVNYVLDGQQRITSFFAAINGSLVERDDNKFEDFSKIYIDLDAKGEDEIVIVDNSGRPANSTIKLNDLMEGDFTFLAGFPKNYQDVILRYQNIIKGYNFNIINLKEASIDVATEVFTRLNVGGKALSLFEIMVAKTYDAVAKFDLAEKYLQLIKELSKVKYNEIPSSTILQVLAMIISKDCTRKEILKLPKTKFVQNWDEAVDCIKRSVDFFRASGVPVSRLLPYNALLVPFSYFFHLHKAKPTGEMKQMLDDFFWRVSLGNRYSSGVESKLAQDVSKIEKIVKGNLPKYEWSIDVSPESIMEVSTGWFGTGRSYIKAILCLYAMQKPKSFDNNLDVNIDNSWLKISTSKNYHHYFPKAWMKKNYPSMNVWEYNHILNITIVDDYLNKNQIRAAAPASYMKRFEKGNPEIIKTMKTHLIGDFDKFGIWDNDYEKFYQSRAKMVSKELLKRIIEQKTGNEHYDDIPETLEAEQEVEIEIGNEED
ncbi:DUF262 domain-containing protein [Ferruginibacter sp. HRS2-29]|uniref:GmrSD restriction endonuclease domain-containing protein n=1 Tax=Ferruginibacter sp. HRS2-29 TaxID=2487334 RepID=UPI0020CBDF1A|nr:DUF262 domain-containing protein [Ferruginibacter sp. HRS2-29]MCP9752646.1 DUF262 domain-containing protein [Ferruginibacter sp. HRS2-29]